ncbi:MAG: sugar phosphate isomerase/epimerase [Bacteroidales bacterium]
MIFTDGHGMKILVLLALYGLFIMSLQPYDNEQEHYVGLQLWSIREEMESDPGATLQQVADMGYAFIEAASYENGLFYDMNPIQFRNLVKDNQLGFISSHVEKNIEPGETHKDRMHWWDQCINAHLKAGVRYIVQASLPTEAYHDLDLLKQYVQYLNEVGKRCNQKGIRFGFHNHQEEFDTLQGVVIYDYMLENTNPEYVFFQNDLYWTIQGGADPLSYFQKYPGRFILWHVKDHAELGASGTINFERIFREDTLSGRRFIIVEVEDYNFPPLESVRRSLEYLLEAGFL